MSWKQFILLFICVALGGNLSAQKLILGVDFDTRFDNREYAGNTFGRSQTLFSARLSPYAGVQWQEKNNLILGVDMLQDFGDQSKFLTRVRPVMYYQFKTQKVQAYAGIFGRKELMGDYSRAFFSDSTAFYDNRMAGFLGRYQSATRKNTFVEFAINWEGMYSVESREKFRLITAGRYSVGEHLYFGYAFTLFHFANSKIEQNVNDNLLANPFVGVEFQAFFDFDIKGGFLIAPQRARSIFPGWQTPCGGQLDITMQRWGVKFENNLYLGGNLQRFYDIYGGELYAGERFYSTRNNIYNRTWIGYDRWFFNHTVGVEAGMAFQYDGSAMGTQQIVKLSVALGKLINIGSGKRAAK